jgi:flavin-binding protein dodecin
MVDKALELTGIGATVEDAVQEALDRARLTMEGLSRFEITRLSGTLEGSRPVFKVELKLWFTLLERMHG